MRLRTKEYLLFSVDSITNNIPLFLGGYFLFNIKSHIRNWLCKLERTRIGVDRPYLRAKDSTILSTSGTGSSRTKNNNDKF